VKRVISCYVNNGSQVVCTFLDATKAFDRLEYCKYCCSICYWHGSYRQL